MGMRGGAACVAHEERCHAQREQAGGRRKRPLPAPHRSRPYGLDDSALKDLLLKGLASALVFPKRNGRSTSLSRLLLASAWLLASRGPRYALRLRLAARPCRPGELLP